MAKLKIRTVNLDQELCYKVYVYDCSCPEYFIVCKKGFEVLKNLGVIPINGDGLGYVRAKGRTRIHSYLLKVNKGNHVDHINRNKRDNRLVNLREATPSQNSNNKSMAKSNKCGYKYISWSKGAKKYRVVVQNKHLGYFDSLEDALMSRNYHLEKITTRTALNVGKPIYCEGLSNPNGEAETQYPVLHPPAKVVPTFKSLTLPTKVFS